MIDVAKIGLDRVEVIRRVFDSKGRVVEEQIEYYSPCDQDLKIVPIGFRLPITKSKKK